MHGLVSSPSPGHFSPPKAGGGSVQVRVRFCSPPPYVTGQSLQSFQSNQLPSTRYNISKRFLKEIHGYEAVSEFKKKQKKQQYLLRQGASLHGLVSSLSPGHFSPPNAGGGLVQVRVRLSSPPPQVTGQALHSFQSDQLLSTSNETHMKHYCGCCSNHFAFISHRLFGLAIVPSYVYPKNDRTCICAPVYS